MYVLLQRWLWNVKEISAMDLQSKFNNSYTTKLKWHIDLSAIMLFCIAALYEEDHAALRPLPRKAFTVCRYEWIRADGYGKICLDGKHYYSTRPSTLLASMPTRWMACAMTELCWSLMSGVSGRSAQTATIIIYLYPIRWLVRNSGFQNLVLNKEV